MSVSPAPASPSPVASVPVTWRLPVFRADGLPMLPVAILVTLALMAIFANVIAPYNPEIGTLSQRFRGAAGVARGPPPSVSL
jgi:ABC-type antimicrobial peptide transport system permease subunit